jgi:serine protease AprX
VLVEMRVRAGTPAAIAHDMATALASVGFAVDHGTHPTPVAAMPHHAVKLDASGHEVVIAHGTVDERRIAELKAHADVLHVWRDAPIGPFASRQRLMRARTAAPADHCPVPPCDCTYGDPPNGTFETVAKFLGVDHIWAAGHRGHGIVVGVVDAGICAIGRTPKAGEVARIKNVIDGYPSDWGTTGAPLLWHNHGNMSAADVLAMAPGATLYDIRISGGTQRRDRIGRALHGFEWAIKRHRADGTPHILTSSWGIWQQSDEPGYATDPNHPFTRKVVEAIDEGILVLFCAGNCGATCQDARCKSDVGAKRGIWGANGHPRVMTVGAVNLAGHFVGYSSIGPAALDPDKPDFCAPTHFAGYFPDHDPDQDEPSDTGTSAATAITAGVLALLRERCPTLTQDQAKAVLKSTAKNIGPKGFDRFTGAGIIHAKTAWDSLPHVAAGRTGSASRGRRARTVEL